MQDEELDKMINDAANQHHPAYDDEAWGRMHALLDKHLPQKKDRRKPFIFWLLFLLLGGTTATVIMQPWKNNKTVNTPVAAASTKTTTQNNTTNADNTNTAVVTPVNKAEGEKTVTKQIENITGNEPAAAYKPTVPDALANSNNATTVVRGNNSIIKKNGRTAIKVKAPTAMEDNNGNEDNFSLKKINGKTKTKVQPAQPADDENETVAAANQTDSSVKSETFIVKTESNDSVKGKTTAAPQKDTAEVTPQLTAATVTPVKKQNNNKGFKNNFAVTVSAGADKSFIETTNPGKTKFMYGVGAAYTFAKRFTASAGFYVSKKVYNATPSQYKFSTGAWYPYLWQINANCLVYEIPVNIYYNFAPAKKHSWFAGGGISSIIMKEEYYNYKSKTPSGQVYNYEHTYSNENKHFLSLVTLSGGYRYRLSNRIQFMAEPYVKLPLSGIGAGAIKLKSGGILFTAAIKPFVKKQSQ